MALKIFASAFIQALFFIGTICTCPDGNLTSQFEGTISHSVASYNREYCTWNLPEITNANEYVLVLYFKRVDIPIVWKDGSWRCSGVWTFPSWTSPYAGLSFPNCYAPDPRCKIFYTTNGYCTVSNVLDEARKVSPNCDGSSLAKVGTLPTEFGMQAYRNGHNKELQIEYKYIECPVQCTAPKVCRSCPVTIPCTAPTTRTTTTKATTTTTTTTTTTATVAATVEDTTPLNEPTPTGGEGHSGSRLGDKDMQQSQNTTILLVAVVVLGCLLIIVTIASLVLYNRHKQLRERYARLGVTDSNQNPAFNHGRPYENEYAETGDANHGESADREVVVNAIYEGSPEGSEPDAMYSVINRNR